MELLIGGVVALGFVLCLSNAKRTEVPTEQEEVTAEDALSAAQSGCSYLVAIVLLIVGVTILLPMLVPLPP